MDRHLCLAERGCPSRSTLDIKETGNLNWPARPGQRRCGWDSRAPVKSAGIGRFQFWAIGLFSFLLCLRTHASGEYVISNLWSVYTANWCDTAPAVGPDGTIYFGSFDGKLWAVTPTGKKKWTFRCDLEIKSSPALAKDGTIYFGARDTYFYALNPNGKKIWKFKTGSWVDASPAVGSDDRIYFGSWDGKFYALDKSGTKQWEFQTGGEIFSSAAIDASGSIYFGSFDHKFYCLGADGSKKWSFDTDGAIVSSPAINGSKAIYFSSLDGYVYAQSPDGKLLWKLHTGGVTESSPAIGTDGTVFIGVNHELWAINPDGTRRWERGNDGTIESTPFLLANGAICYLTTWGVLMALDMERGVLWYGNLGNLGYCSSNVGDSGAIYCSQSGTAFSAFQNHSPLAKSPWPRFRGNRRNTGNIADQGN